MNSFLAAVVAACAGPLLCAWERPAHAAEPSVEIDAAVVRFAAPEIGGMDRPRFILRRVLAFEARLEALADPGFRAEAAASYLPSHVQSAVARHIAETILESLEVSPAPSQADIAQRVAAARVALAVRAGGAQALDAAARAEGLEPHEVLRIVQRQARASLYLDRMVAPMLEPSGAQLRNLHQSGRTPFSRLAFEEAEAPLRRWLVARKLREAVLNYYDTARNRVSVRFL